MGTKTKSERAGKNATSKISILSPSPLSAPGYPMMAITGDWFEFDTPLPAVLFYAPLVALDSLVALLSLRAGSHWEKHGNMEAFENSQNQHEKDIVESFYPPEEIKSQAYVSSMDRYKELYAKSIENPAEFWGRLCKRVFLESRAKQRQLHAFQL